MSDEWQVVTAALGASLLTTLGTWFVTWRHDSRTAKAQDAAQARAAVQRVMSLSFEVALRAQQLGVIADHHSSWRTSFSVLMRTEPPPDIVGTLEPMLQAQQALAAATSNLWLSGNQELVTLSNRVHLAAADVTDQLMARRTPGTASADTDAILKPLMKARVELAAEARRQLKVTTLDLQAE